MEIRWSAHIEVTWSGFTKSVRSRASKPNMALCQYTWEYLSSLPVLITDRHHYRCHGCFQLHSQNMHSYWYKSALKLRSKYYSMHFGMNSNVLQCNAPRGGVGGGGDFIPKMFICLSLHPWAVSFLIYVHVSTYNYFILLSVMALNTSTFTAVSFIHHYVNSCNFICTLFLLSLVI